MITQYFPISPTIFSIPSTSGPHTFISVRRAEVVPAGHREGKQKGVDIDLFDLYAPPQKKGKGYYEYAMKVQKY